MKKPSNQQLISLRPDAIILISCLAFLVSGCLEDQTISRPSAIQFASGIQSVNEGEEAIAKLTFDRAASKDGLITISVAGSAVYGEHYTSDPAIVGRQLVVNVADGDQDVSFKVRITDDTKFLGEKSITLTIVSVSSGFRLGTTRQLTFNIHDDEGPSLAAFEVHAAEVEEADTAGLLINVQLSDPAKGSGTVGIFLESAEELYGTHFITTPAAVDGLIDFEIEENDTGFSFRVLPVNNDVFTDDLVVKFSIDVVTGVVRRGSLLTCALTIQDDEKASIANFASSEAVVDEQSAEGLTIEIDLSSPVKGDGIIVVNFESQDGEYKTDFTTSPAAIGNSITLNLSQDQTKASFIVLPVDNDLYEGNIDVVYSCVVFRCDKNRHRAYLQGCESRQ
jgi:hypothetical protein